MLMCLFGQHAGQFNHIRPAPVLLRRIVAGKDGIGPFATNGSRASGWPGGFALFRAGQCTAPNVRFVRRADLCERPAFIAGNVS
ncbi:MAG: hypothetical protein ACK5JR_18100 [Tropicimonas sp.]|uniref:hypothetical protein n=1 Tax=Tropicimonas sp. TaxID=2067044 RepID=UPI003A88E03D